MVKDEITHSGLVAVLLEVTSPCSSPLQPPCRDCSDTHTAPDSVTTTPAKDEISHPARGAEQLA